MSNSQNLADYLTLAKLSYQEAVDTLLKKYGPVRDDYFRPVSYLRFLDGTNSQISSGKYSRIPDGLYAHHINELQFPNIGQQKAIRVHLYPFKYQERSQLVYANLIEHLILHALITNATKINEDLGFKGYIFLQNQVRRWYIKKLPPKQAYLQPAYETAFLTVTQAQELIDHLETKLVPLHRRYQDLSQRIRAEWERIPFYMYANILDDWNKLRPKVDLLLQQYQETVPRLSNDEIHQIIFNLAKPYLLTTAQTSVKPDPQALDELYSDALKEDRDFELFKTLTLEQVDRLHDYDDALREDQYRQCRKEAALQKAQSELERRKNDKQLVENAKKTQQTDHDSKTQVEMPSRQSVLEALYGYVDHAKVPTFNQFKASKINDVKDKLIDELESHLKNHD